MANWTGLAGAAGLAAALEGIQDRRVRKGQLQRELTQGQGEWTPATGGMGGPLGFFDALFGYNKPGQIGFGGQRYQFQPYPRMTEEDVRGLGLTMPQTTTTPAYLKESVLEGQGPRELVPEQQTTREMPLPGFVGARLDPKTRQALALERFKEHRDLAKLQEEYRLAGMGLEPGGAGATDMSTPAFKIPGMEETPVAGTPGAPATGTVAPAVPVKPAAGAKIPLGTPTKEMEDAIAEAHRLYPQVRPELIRAIMARESNFDPTAVSGKGAKGPMGLMPDTWKEMGVKDPHNIMDATIGGTKYFAQQLAKYGSEELALAAYNAGPGKVDAAGKTIPKIKETSEYVPWVMERARPDAFKPAAAPGAQAQVPTPAVGGTGMQVAGGTGAPAPPTTQPAPTTPPTTTVAPTQAQQAPATVAQPGPQQPAAGPYKPSDALIAQVNNNKQQMAANDSRIMQLEQERRMAQVQARRNMPGATDRLRMYSDQQDSLRKQNAVLRKEAEDAYTKEYGTWQQTQTKVGEEGRKPSVEAETKTAVQDAEISEDLRGTKFDLVDKGLAPNKDWKDYTSQEKALVQRSHSERKQEATNIEKMNEWERSALFQITKDEGTPQGRATDSQLRRARAEGRKQELAYEQQKKIALGEATLDTVMGETDALRWINPATRQPATAMTPRQAKEAGYMLMAKPQQDTLRNGYNSVQYIDRLNTLYFGGIDKDGSITGQAGTQFEGIYPWVEKTRKETQTVGGRASQTMAVRTGLLQGKTMAQWARVADNFIDASLGAISRDLGGERGHFTDIDAQRARKFFTNFGSSWWGKTLGDPNLMRSSGEAKDMMGLVAGVITDRVRGALDLAPGDPLPWNIQGTLLPKPLPPEQRQQRGTPTTGTTQKPAPATGTPAAAQAPAPQPTQESVPAPSTGAAPKKLDGPTAQQHMQQALGELFPGRAVQSLSVDEKRQMLERMRAIGSAAGFTP